MKTFKASLSIFTSISMFAGISISQAKTIGVPETGVELGIGWDSQTASVVRNRCIRFAPIEETGQSIEMEVTEVSDSSDVADTLNVSASMAINSKFGSASAQANFSKKSKVTSTSNSLLIRASVNNGVMFVGPPRPPELTRNAFSRTGTVERDYISSWNYWVGEDLPRQVTLTDEAKNILGGGDIQERKEFEHYCGDSFIGSIFSGAEILAIMSFTSKTRSSAKTSKKSAQAAVSAWGTSVDVAGSKTASSQVSGTDEEIQMEFTQIGGTGGIIPTDKDQFFQKLNNLPKEALEGPKFHTMSVVAYNTLPDWPQNIPLETEDETIDVVLTNYYSTLTSIDYLLEDLRTQNNLSDRQILDAFLDQIAKKKGKPAPTIAQLRKFAKDKQAETQDVQIERINDVQDKVNEFRQDIYDLLSQSYQLDQIKKPLIPDWKIWRKAEKEANEKERTDLEKLMKQQAKKLQKFSFGVNNPNLIKLYLPAPREAVLDGNDDYELRAHIAVERYLAAQSKRICRQNPLSAECLSNDDMDALKKCVPTSDNWLAIPATCEFAKTK
ncbi:MAG: hypothetical protein ABJN38_17420 [Lentilitoribacter sp.]